MFALQTVSRIFLHLKVATGSLPSDCNVTRISARDEVTLFACIVSFFKIRLKEVPCPERCTSTKGQNPSRIRTSPKFNHLLLVP